MRPARDTDGLRRWAVVVVATTSLCHACRSSPRATPDRYDARPNTPVPSLVDVDDEMFDTAPLSSPLPLPTKPRFVAGLSHACVLPPTGLLRCWGSNDYGQLGDFSVTPRTAESPAEVLIEGVVRVTLGSRFTCALRVDRTVWCWGSGPIGPAWGESLVPKKVGGLGPARGLMADGSALCVAEADDVRCWGRNWQPGGKKPALVLDDTPVALGVGAIAGLCPAQPTGTVVARSNGEVVLVEGLLQSVLSSPTKRSTTAPLRALRCSNSSQLWMLTGDGLVTLSETVEGSAERRVSVLALPPIRALGVSVGPLRSAVGVDGPLYAWGDNQFGELAEGTRKSRPTPAAIEGLSDVSTAGLLTGGGCAVAKRGLWCWGNNLSWVSSSTRPALRVKALW